MNFILFHVDVIMIGDYITSKTIGTGAFGTVKLAKKRDSETQYAIKSISKQSILRTQMGPQVKKEISIMKGLDHPNIVKIFEVLMSTECLYIVMAFAPGGELYSKITRNGKLSDAECRRYVHQLCSALDYCHSMNVCHRDIKPENILLDKDDNALLADFGFASIIQIDDNVDSDGAMEGQSKVLKKMSTVCGTLPYMAPEILNREKYLGDKVDIWALGVVIYVLLVGFMPFKDTDLTKSNYRVPKDIERQAADFVSKMLVLEPSKRCSAGLLLKHPWVSQEPVVLKKHEKHDSLSSTESESSEDGVQSLDFSFTATNLSDKKLLEAIEEKMNSEGWKTRPMGSSLKASCMSINGVVMVEVSVSSKNVDVRHANLSKDANAKVMNDLQSVLLNLEK